MTTVEIRPLIPEDAIQLATLADNPKIWKNVRDYFPSPYTLPDAELFIGFCGREKPVCTFAVVADHAFCGVAGLIEGQDVNRISAEIGYWIGEPFWGKGIATKAIELLTEYGFNTLGYHRIYAAIFEYNTASMRVLVKNGYYPEGIFKESVIKNGVIYDDHRFAKLSDE